MVSTELRRAAVSFLKERGLSERRSCVLIGTSRSGLRYQAHPRDDSDLAERLREIARRHKRYGYRRALALLRRDQLKVNHKRVQRVWQQLGLPCPVRQRRKRSQHPGPVPQEALHPNHVWTYDFVCDTTSDSRTLKFLTVVDEFTRECLAIKVAHRLPAQAVMEVLRWVFAERGVPAYLRSDNGPEFIAKAIQGWLKERQVKPHYIEPGSPWQNAYGESFNGKFRDECLNMELFYSVSEAEPVVETWRRDYNTQRPHSSLNYQTPAEFRAAWDKQCALKSESPQSEPVSLALSRGLYGAHKEGQGTTPCPPQPSSGAALRSLSSGAVSSGQTQTSIAPTGSRCIMTLAEEAKP
jgi:putative transposase